jgi:hypothetical protein
VEASVELAECYGFTNSQGGKGNFREKIVLSLVIAMSLTLGASYALSTDSIAQQWTDSMNSSLHEMGESPAIGRSCVQEILDDKSNAELKRSRTAATRP